MTKEFIEDLMDMLFCLKTNFKKPKKTQLIHHPTQDLKRNMHKNKTYLVFDNQHAQVYAST